MDIFPLLIHVFRRMCTRWCRPTRHHHRFVKTTKYFCFLFLHFSLFGLYTLAKSQVSTNWRRSKSVCLFCQQIWASFMLNSTVLAHKMHFEYFCTSIFKWLSIFVSTLIEEKEEENLNSNKIMIFAWFLWNRECRICYAVRNCKFFLLLFCFAFRLLVYLIWNFVCCDLCCFHEKQAKQKCNSTSFYSLNW